MKASACAARAAASIRPRGGRVGAEGDRVGDGGAEQRGGFEGVGDRGAQCVRGHVRQGCAVQQHAALVGVAEPTGQRREGGLARAGMAHHGHRRSGRNDQVEPVQHRRVAAPDGDLADEPTEHLRQLSAAQQRFLAGGVTTIGDCQVTRREFDTYLRLASEGQLKTRVTMYLLSHLLDHAVDIGMHGAFGNARLAVAGIKFYVDGTLGGWTAYFPDGYAADPCRTGQLYHEPDAYAALIGTAHAVGLQTATHAQSPDAIEIVLNAVEAAQADRPDTDARHRIEHCGLPTPEQIKRMHHLGVYPVNQPQHYYNWGEGVAEAIGSAGERFNPLGEFVDAGVPVTLSSDAPVAEPKPLEAIQAAVTRLTRRGRRLGQDGLRIATADAVAAHTINGARVLGREAELGTITPGKRANFAVLSADPLAVAPESIAAIEVTQTWVDGEQQHPNPAPSNEV